MRISVKVQNLETLKSFCEIKLFDVELNNGMK